MAPPRTVVTTSSCSLLLIYWPQKDERLSWPSWLTYSGRFTHISGHPSAVGRAQDSETSPVKDRRSTAAPRNQPIVGNWCLSVWRSSDFCKLLLLLQFSPILTKPSTHNLCPNTQKTVKQIFEILILKYLANFISGLQQQSYLGKLAFSGLGYSKDTDPMRLLL